MIEREAMICGMMVMAFSALCPPVQAATPTSTLGAGGPSGSVQIVIMSFDGKEITASVLLRVAGDHRKDSVHLEGWFTTSKEEGPWPFGDGIHISTAVVASVGKAFKDVVFSSDTNTTTYQYTSRFASTYSANNVLGIPFFPLDQHSLNLNITADFDPELDVRAATIKLPNDNYVGTCQIVSAGIADSQYKYKLYLDIGHTALFQSFWFFWVWGVIFLLSVVTGFLGSVLRRLESAPEKDSSILSISSAIVLFLPLFELSLQSFKSPLTVVWSDVALFVIMAVNLALLIRTVSKRSAKKANIESSEGIWPERAAATFVMRDEV